MPFLHVWAAPPGGPARRSGGSPCPSASPRPSAALGLASGGPGHASGLKAVALAVGLPPALFAPLLGSLGRPAASCPLACGGALAPSRPVLGFPPPRRAAARRCSPRLPPPALARLRAGPLAPPAGPPGPSVGARARPGGAPLPRRGCLSLAGGPLLPARGLSARCAGLGGLRSAPPRVGVWRAAARNPVRALRLMPPCPHRRTHQSGKWCKIF